MDEQKYNWLRFWRPRETTVRLTEQGTLQDPEQSYGHILNPHAVTLDALEDTRCLVLLGDPGSGKSYELEQEVERHREQQGGRQVLHFQLRDFQTDGKLCQDIFDNNPGFQAWINEDGRLYLYLDSLDEGLLNVLSLATLLVREFKKYPPDFLYVRIACRTAEWPEVLENGLVAHWGAANYRAFELLPLRDKDIAEAARSDGINPESFFNEIRQKAVGPLAAKPVTLKFLLKLYKKHGELPRSQAELYAEGCRYLCEESSQSRMASRHRGSLSANKRFLIAQRIAAITIFGNRAAVWTGLTAETPDSDIAVEQLASGSEGAGIDRFAVGDEEIRETLNTGLFSSRGLNRVGWAHQTYAEFLAARYLVESRVSLDQKIVLITHPSDGRLIPQLHETAAWLGSMDRSVFREIGKTDPAVLLRSDVASADTKDKIALVDALLEAAENGEWIDSDWSGTDLYSKLSHDTLAQQLAPFIIDKTRGIFARRIAADIADACKVLDLQDSLAQVALDAEDHMTVRVNAAYAVVHIGDSATRGKLRPVALAEAGDDPDDELKGVGLRAVWPGHLSSEELFEVLTPPKRPSLLGSYKMSINHLASNFDGIDLTVGLNWLAQDSERFDSLSPFRSVRNEILRRALQNIETPAIADALANIMVDNVLRLRGDGEYLATVDNVDDEKRHKLLESVIPRLAHRDKQTPWYGLIYGEGRLIVPADVPWLLDFLRSKQSPETQKLVAEIISRILDSHNTDHVGLVINAARNSTVLAETCGWFLFPVYLESEQADMQRQTYAEVQEMNRGIPKPPPLDPPPIERVRRLLDRFESGETGAWWLLNREMTLQETSKYYGDESESDLSKLPVWRIATPEDKRRLTEAAKKYLSEAESQPNKWLGKNNLMWRPAYAGYRALRLLHDADSAYLAALSAEHWKNWASIVVAYPFQNEVSVAEAQAKLVERAYKNSPDEVVRVVLALITKDNKTDGYLSVLTSLKYCWDDRLRRALTKKMQTGRLKSRSMGQLLSELLAYDAPEARRYAERQVRSKSASPTAKERAAIAARALVLNAEDAGWNVIWPRIQKDREFGRQLIESISGSISVRNTPVAARLSEGQLADLFIWLAHEYPHSTDPRHEGVFSPGPDDYARRFRDATLSGLKQRGTIESVAALERVAKELPELDWLRWMVVEAREIRRRHSWKPVSASDILRITHDRDSRLVNSGEQLLQAIIESLKRLERKLHGETPAAIDLWNEVSAGVYRPRDENRLSDYVKRHLEEDLKNKGVIANREVEIRRGEGDFQGQNTDIHIDAIGRDPESEAYDSITAIIETKGCWNRELATAMETQLKNRYLKDNACGFGLYLVGWFNCSQWDSDDRRQAQAPDLTKREAQEKFDEQSLTLSDHSVTLKAFVLDVALSS